MKDEHVLLCDTDWVLPKHKKPLPLQEIIDDLARQGIEVTDIEMHKDMVDVTTWIEEPMKKYTAGISHVLIKGVLK